MNLYYIKLNNNGHGDIFLFTSYNSAVEWAKSNTVWTGLEIPTKIKKITKNNDNFFKISY